MRDDRTPLASRGGRERSTSLSSTEAQNRFGDVLDLVSEGETVYVTKYNKTRAVVVSAERYRELTGEEEPDLGELAREFDEMVARMQGEGAAAGFDALFEMDGAALGEIAAEAGQRDED